MIINEDLDTASIHTLVSPSHAPTEVRTSQLPPYLAPLSFAFLSVSIPSFIFALICIHVSLAHTLPVVLTFAITVPFHFAALYFFRNDLTQRWRFPRTRKRKAIVVACVVLLQAIWTASTINLSMLLVNTNQKIEQFCYPILSGTMHPMTNPNKICINKVKILVLVILLFSSASSVLLAIISYVLSRWHLDPSSPQPPASPQLDSPDNEVDEHIVETYLIIPLTAASIAFTMPPFVVAVENFLLWLSIFSIMVFIAYTLVVYFHISTLVKWYRCCRGKNDPRDLIPPLDFYLVLIEALWMVSTILSFLTPSFSVNMFNCVIEVVQDGIVFSGVDLCTDQATLSFIPLNVSLIMEVLVLGSVVAISLRDRLRRRRLQIEAPQSPRSSTVTDSRRKVACIHQHHMDLDVHCDNH